MTPTSTNPTTCLVPVPHPKKCNTKKCDPSSNLHNKMGHTYSCRTFLSKIEKGTRLSLFKPNHVLSVCQPVSRLLVKRILLVSWKHSSDGGGRTGVGPGWPEPTTFCTQVEKFACSMKTSFFPFSNFGQWVP